MCDRVLDDGAALSPPVRVGSDDGRASPDLLVIIDGGGIGGHLDVAGAEFRVQDDGAGNLRTTDVKVLLGASH